MGLPVTVRLSPGAWIRLPGTDIEVYLMGKYRDGQSTAIWVHRVEDPQTHTHYWDLTAIYTRLYVRGVDVYGYPTNLAEAIRPPIRRHPRRTTRECDG